MKLQGKFVLITGASGGIGRALTLALAQAGARLALAARRRAPLEAVADEVAAQGHERPVIFDVDLSQQGDAQRLAEQTLTALGQVDVLINNAAFNIAGSQWSIGDGNLARQTFETNYFSPLALVQRLVPSMRARGAGAVVNMASIGALATEPLLGHYASSKAALALATEALSLELRGSGVQALLVIPGPVETPMLDELREVPGGAALVRLMPRGTPQEIAQRIVNAIERGKTTLVFPPLIGVFRHLPALARLGARLLTRDVQAEQAVVFIGGSYGNMKVRGRGRDDGAK